MFLNLSNLRDNSNEKFFFSVSIYIHIDLFTVLAIAVSIILQSQFLLSKVALNS